MSCLPFFSFVIRNLSAANGGLLALLLASTCGAAEIIPADRRMNWTPGVNVGVPGGIPNRTTIFVNVLTTATAAYKCKGDGVTDDSVHIQNALNDCPANQVVYLPAGTYRMNNSITTQKSFMSLRGAGQGQTILMYYGGSGRGVIEFGSEDWPGPGYLGTNKYDGHGGITITAGATVGSTMITVGSTTAVNVGTLVRIDPVNPPYVHNFNGLNANPTMSFVFKVTTKTATTVSFNPALPMDLSAMSPKLFVYSASLVEGFGVEDLTIDLDHSPDVGAAIHAEQTWGCWLKNVEARNTSHFQLQLWMFNAGEIRHCYTHGSKGSGPGHEGMDFGSYSCWNLIEDNITYQGGYPNILIGDWVAGGCQGNVVAYNYCDANNSADPSIAGADISFSHGGHDVLNLAEGNITGKIQADGYWGSSSHNTIFRNWITATERPSAIHGLQAIDLCHMNNYFNIVGNVLGTSAFPASPNGLYTTEVESFDDATHLIYRLGYPNMGNNGYGGTWPATAPPDYRKMGSPLEKAQEFDPNVKNTILRHGNYDYANKAIVWDPSISDHKIPASLFRTAKPAWFGNLAWPPVDPATPGRLAIVSIPAGYRYVHGTEPLPTH